jgi:hypothetical protein
MRKINQEETAELESLIKGLELANLETTLLELTEMRTSKIEDLTMVEAAILTRRFKNVDDTYYLEIKDI